MHTIERRSPRVTLQYTLAHTRYFESVDRYEPGDSYEATIRRQLPGDWSTTRSGLALHATPPQLRMADAGFKIHLSSTAETAERCLEVAVALCVREGLAFKAVLDPFLLNWLNSAVAPLSGSGKFVTIYPADVHEFKSIADQLAAGLAGVEGPYILSDARHPASRAVFYRYGGFVPQSRRNVYGEAVALYTRADGSVTHDERKAAYALPADVEDPYGATQPGTSEVLLNQRYRVTALLHRSNKGGVYKAHDTLTDLPVVIKEGRRFVRNGDGCDATELLRNERAVLERLADTGLTPQVVELFEEWENAFLVIEFLPGEMLIQYRARVELAILAQPPGRVMLGPLLALARDLCAGLQTIHDRGVIVGDLAPQNILVDPVTRKLSFIDFETSCFTDAPRASRTGTPGFVSAGRDRGDAVTTEDDRFALARILYSIVYPVCGLFHLQPAPERELLRTLSAAKQLPFSLERVVYDATADLAGASARIAHLEVDLGQVRDDASPIGEAQACVSNDQLEHDLLRMRSAVVASATLDREDRVFPADWRVFATNPLSLAFGAAGVCQLLEVTGGVPAPIARRVEALCTAPAVADCPAGLYVGVGGIAWMLARLGRLDPAAAIMRRAYDVPSRYESADLYFGCAGWGLASLHIYRRTSDVLFLERAREVARHLASKSWGDKEGFLPLSEAGHRFHGLAHGAAGVALFLLRLWQVTADPEHRAQATRFLELDLQSARPLGAAMTWTSTVDGSLIAPWWRYGNAGMILVLLRFHAALGESRYLDLARAAAVSLTGYFSTLPGQFSGMAGVGLALLELGAATGESSWGDEARSLAARVRLFAVEEPGGIGFPGEDLQRVCHDLGTGTAGVGLFFAQLARATAAPSVLDED